MVVIEHQHFKDCYFLQWFQLGYFSYFLTFEMRFSRDDQALMSNIPLDQSYGLITLNLIKKRSENCWDNLLQSSQKFEKLARRILNYFRLLNFPKSIQRRWEIN